MAIVIYYSERGTNARIARSIGDVLGSEVREIKSVRRYSFLGKVFGSRMRKRFPIQPMDMSLSRFDSVVLCAPVWAGGPACQLMTFVDQADWDGKKVAVVLGCGALQTARALGIIRAALESKGASVLAGEVIDTGKLRGEALAMAARDIASALAAKREC
jgi:hypothetical protein